jgi:acetolactate synthase-1/2/3 large subunit
MIAPKRLHRPNPGCYRGETMDSRAHETVRMLQRAGVQRLFGMPGGGGNADLLESARALGLPFTLAHTETAGAFMACAQAEITGRPGACLATLGPGAASIVNGVAQAHLDRVPLIVITDPPDPRYPHQRLPQQDLLAPLVKWSGSDLDQALDAVTSPPYGPVHLQEGAETRRLPPLPVPHALPVADIPAKRPVMLVGLGASTGAREFCESRRIPALVTYKAKGVIPDDHPWFAGVLTNGALEKPALDRADVFVTAGFDPVELIARPWTHRRLMVPMERAVVASAWTTEEVRALAEAQRAAMRPAVEPGELAPHRVVEIAAEVYSGARIAVDAGAHMFPVMSLWQARVPRGVLISNGLATMGFGLPAGIGAALLDSARPVVVFTGDGGLMMCAAELRTAARERLPLRIVVFDDAALTLIQLKQEQRGYDTAATGMGSTDWQAVACGFGVLGRRAADEAGLRAVLRETADHPGPVLIAARISTRTYPVLMSALRGPA